MKAVFTLAFALLLCARGAYAQQDTLAYSTGVPDWVGQFTTLSANAVLGGVTAGLFQELRGGSFKDGFTRGALGGVVIYAGKRVAAERFYGAGLIGREVAAVGASVVRNASDGIPSFERLILPAGFMRVYWQRPQGRVRVKLDIMSAGLTVYGVVEDHLEFDARESLSGGMPVFRTNNEIITYGTGEQHAAGISRAGIILRAHVPAWRAEFLDRALAHERVHVLQDDQLFITLNDHADDWLFSKLGPARRVSRYVDLNVSSEVLAQLSRLIPEHGDRPWEMEAIYLTRR
ncbi:MAG: hypothetical protein ACT4O1_05245 [Gemmatimonadota bacterium]